RARARLHEPLVPGGGRANGRRARGAGDQPGQMCSGDGPGPGGTGARAEPPDIRQTAQGTHGEGGATMTTRITRKQFLRTALYGGASLAIGAPRVLEALQVGGPALDVVVVNGRIVDGTGRAAYAASLAIRDGRIVDIGN